MEFFQFHPTGIKGMGILITEGVRGEGGILRNRSGERFMERYAPTLLDLAPRDMVSRAILTEIREGRGMRGDRRLDDYLLLDATHLGREVVEKKLPDITDFCRTYLGIDPADKPIPIQPTAHYAMGGIPTDLEGRVVDDRRVYEGLYAAGECACVSVHGANRLGTNSLVDLVVFGRRAGRHIAEYVRQADAPGDLKDADGRARARLAELKDGRKGPPSGPFYIEMQDLMMNQVGVYRTEDEMTVALKKLQDLRDRYSEVRAQEKGSRFNAEVLNILELGNLIDLALVTTASAINRRESRGAHAREDFPERDDAGWLKHTLAWLERGGVRIGYKPVDTSRFKPKPRVY
jgi:succinate dehydrogenase / fumarate reductase flavoprotein subunit